MMTGPEPQQGMLPDILADALVELDAYRAKYRVEVEPLKAIADAARYMVAAGAYEGCIEDGVCEEGLDPCPHVTTHYATCTDRLVAERLIHFVGEVWELVRARPGAGDDIVGDLVDLLHTAACTTMTIIDDADPRGSELERPQVLADIVEAYDLELAVWSEERRRAAEETQP